MKSDAPLRTESHLMSLRDHDQDPPAYSWTPPFGSQLSLGVAEHRYSLETSKGHPWISLFVKSRSASSKLPPLFLENDLIAGRVELDLPNLATLKAIEISVRVQWPMGKIDIQAMSRFKLAKPPWGSKSCCFSTSGKFYGPLQQERQRN
jgi:hypothetical protein